ncbi:phosphate signaling complex protein PhoU [Evansella cellulosilytica]|uniref:Phosphate-specific transport system accessory protein PhoU n=1 Tax=Evansella cellulosilytica (strain ATCC 21833 / DSM 2522 / FERM P-1141 / JCM 9156 / N-4) TaxID=649639 RepID=E6TYT5_EVAC2|nr:phosphate signaling complex protein PhoU [Evansella cellulosilytica]ADU31270.1 phosphate uptake regulator, PhoU [Evansella cellulosilytica DSM 2522]
MAIRGQFELELEDLKKEINLLASMVEQSFREMMEAFEQKQYAKMDDIILHDKQINDAELAINEKATLMIARQQPVASDLRKIIVSLKVSSDLERMGDLTVDMAKAAKRFVLKDELAHFKKDLLELAVRAKEMVDEVITAYNDLNVLAAQKIATMDDEVDRSYAKFVQSLFDVVAIETGVTEQITQMAFISRYIERIADYCTNIAEWIIYEVNGKRFDLN